MLGGFAWKERMVMYGWLSVEAAAIQTVVDRLWRRWPSLPSPADRPYPGSRIQQTTRRRGQRGSWLVDTGWIGVHRTFSDSATHPLPLLQTSSTNPQHMRIQQTSRAAASDIRLDPTAANIVLSSSVELDPLALTL